ncbi:hypothetical protein [Marinoscillum sp.]|uniref:hypothetical protein n=1 Tax=Marinoscillum sp. TaxID=2024838 RepID=UPI003BA946FF
MDIIDVGLYAGYVLIAICALAAVVFPIIQIISDPQALIKSGIGLGALIVVAVVGYALADPNAAGATESVSKWVGAGLIAMYIFFAVAVVGIVYTEISKLIK